MFPTLSTLSRNSVGAGLPNITGTFTDNGTYDGNRTNGYTTSGAFTASGSRGRAGSGGISNSANCKVTLTASRSSSIYGKSKTVTPLSRKCLFLVKY